MDDQMHTQHLARQGYGARFLRTLLHHRELIPSQSMNIQ